MSLSIEEKSIFPCFVYSGLDPLIKVFRKPAKKSLKGENI